MLNRQWILKSRPVGSIADSDFEFIESPMPTIEDGEALIRNVWLAFDPTQRTWLNEGDTYIKAVELGDVMRGAGVGQVVESRSGDLPVGTWVAGMSGWQDFSAASSGGLFGFNAVPPGVLPRMMLTLFGATGLTAYFGMTEVGAPRAGETVYVSGAAGATGSIAAQIAKQLGARVIGSAGSDEKCEWLKSELQLDETVNYKTHDLSKALAAFAPDGIDVFFDNVGGAALEAALDNLAVRGRIVLCGGISTGYDLSNMPPGPRNYLEIGMRRARMEGFVFLDYVAKFPEAFGRLNEWHATRVLKIREDMQHGLEHAPSTLRRLFEGKNFGKQLLQISDDVPSDV